MDSYLLDGEYCPVSRDDDILGTNQSLQSYADILQRALQTLEEIIPHIAQIGDESDILTWTEVNSTLSAYSGLMEKFYPQMVDAHKRLARIPSYSYYDGANGDSKEQTVLCIIVNCAYFDEAENFLEHGEVSPRNSVEFDDGAQEKFIGSVQLIEDKFELHRNIIDGMISWVRALDIPRFDGFKVLFTEPNSEEKTLQSVIESIAQWINCRSSQIPYLLEDLKEFPNLADVAEEMSRDL